MWWFVAQGHKEITEEIRQLIYSVCVYIYIIYIYVYTAFIPREGGAVVEVLQHLLQMKPNSIWDRKLITLHGCGIPSLDGNTSGRTCCSWFAVSERILVMEDSKAELLQAPVACGPPYLKGIRSGAQKKKVSLYHTGQLAHPFWHGGHPWPRLL